MRILVTGKNGQVGWELQRSLASLGEVVAVGREEMDLTNPVSIRDKIKEVKPNFIVNAAAYTAVDMAESEAGLAKLINAEAPGILAEQAKKINATLIHYSTDYVFDGKKSSPYSEEDQPNPINVYGETKLAGEKNIAASGAKHIIVRTSWVYSMRGNNFLLTMLRLIQEREEIKIVSDQFGTPTWARFISDSTAKIITQLPNYEFNSSVSHVFHLTAAKSTNWFEFAKEISQLASNSTEAKGIKFKKLIDIPTSEYPTPAERPKNSRLSSKKVSDAFSLDIRDWQTYLTQCVQNDAAYALRNINDIQVL